jgi:hypothetical protein
VGERRIDLEFAQKALGAAITRPRDIITVDSASSYRGRVPG